MRSLSDLCVKILRKKYLILLFVSCLICFKTLAQPKLGVKFSPSIVFNRLKIDSDSVNVLKNGSGLRPSFGLIAEFPVTDMYSFSTGLTYISKSVKIIVDPIANGSGVPNKYSVQYLQIPLTLKMFTNEISIDKKLYFQAGFNAEIQVYNENKSDTETAIKTFSVIDLPLVFGAGLEMNLGTSTVLFAGLSYQRGLINISAKENFKNKEFSIKNDLLGLDVGLKF